MFDPWPNILSRLVILKMGQNNAEVWITGIGILSALGNGFEENWAALKSGKSALRPIELSGSIHDGKFFAGMVSLSDEELVKQLYDLNIRYPHNRPTLMSLYTARQALRNADIEMFTDKIVLISATTVGGISSTEKHFDNLSLNKTKATQEFLSEMDCGSISRNVCSYLGLSKPHYMISTACSSSNNAIMLGARLIKAGKAEVVLAGGSDSLSKFVLNGFHSLKNLDPKPCTPFDKDRFGLNLGEGAAYLVLESSKHATNRGKSSLAVVAGYGNISETYHITGSSPHGMGAYGAMSLALTSANLNPQEIDFIHSHGTSTIDNDLAESNAIKRLFGNDIAFGSSKGYTGHTLAAAGAISSVLSIGMMQHGFIFPTINFRHPIPETGLSPVTTIKENQHLRHIMVNSFGFGGNNTSLIFSKAA